MTECAAKKPWASRANQPDEIQIEDVDLHDAILEALHVDWANGTCSMEVKHGTLGVCELSFSGLSELTLTRKQIWGRSRSINSFATLNSGWYEIEMQSGDLIRIDASEIAFATSVGN